MSTTKQKFNQAQVYIQTLKKITDELPIMVTVQITFNSGQYYNIEVPTNNTALLLLQEALMNLEDKIITNAASQLLTREPRNKDIIHHIQTGVQHLTIISKLVLTEVSK